MAKKKNPAAVALGRKGGKASAEKLTYEQRQEKARKAARARWAKKTSGKQRNIGERQLSKLEEPQ